MSLVKISTELAVDPDTICAVERKALFTEITTTHGTYQTSADVDLILTTLANVVSNKESEL